MSPPHCSAEPTPSPVATANVSQTATDAMVLTIAMTTLMKSTVELTVKLSFFVNLVYYTGQAFCSVQYSNQRSPSLFQTPLVPRLHSPVPISIVCLQDGAVMGTMTVLTTVMSTIALHRCLERALPISLPVPTTAASHIPGVVTLIMTVETVQMKLIAVSIPTGVITLRLGGLKLA